MLTDINRLINIRTNESLTVLLQSWVNSFSVAFYKLLMYYIEVNLLKTETAQELYEYPSLTLFYHISSICTFVHI